MANYLLNKFNAGISDFDDRGIAGAFKFASGLDIRKQTDSLTCQQGLIEETSGVTALVNFIVESTDGNAYLFCADGKIIKRTSGGVYTTVYTDGNGAILGAAEWYDNAGKTYLYWATATQLNRKELPGASNWSDVNTTGTGTWPKTNLTSATWHTMAVVNGTLQICNDRYIAFVGYDNSYTNNAVDLIPGNSAYCLTERSSYSTIGTGRKDTKEQAGLFLWSGISQNYDDKKYIPVKTIYSIVNTELPLMQCGDGYIYYADTSTVLPVTRFPGGGHTNPDGAKSIDNLAYFGVTGNTTGKTGVYTYGRKSKNQPFALNLEYYIDADEIGSISKVGSDILISSKKGTSYKVYKVNSAAKATGTYQGIDLKTPKDGISGESVWQYVVLTMSALPTGCSVEFWYRVDKSGNFVQSHLQGGGTQATTTGSTEAVFLIGAKGKIFEPMIVLNPSSNSTPEIYKAEIYFT